MTDAARLAPSAVLAEAGRLLGEGGYSVSRDAEEILGLVQEQALVAEDQFAVAAVVVYGTWEALAEGWFDAQAALVEAMSRQLTRADPKAWEGYLVLLTPCLPDPSVVVGSLAIRGDTAKVRKLVAAGDDLSTLDDVRRALLPLLALDSAGSKSTAAPAVLELLTARLSSLGISSGAVQSVVDAFRDRRPLMDALSAYLEKSP